MSPNEIRQLAIQLTRWESVTHSRGERDFASRLHGLLSDWDYFRANPAQVWLERTLDDPYERYNLYALVRGKGEQTLILTGHYDVVSTANYGNLEPYACDPQELAPRLIADLQGTGGAGRAALADLESGDFIPGRGMLDMKSGLALGLSVLERWAALPEPPGNLLFIAVPDEEVASHGMRSAVRQLPGVGERWGLRLEGAINLDVHADPGDGREGRAVFLGSVGKMLPFVLLVGRPTHVGAPFAGVNPTLLAAELVRRLESNPDFGDALGQEEYPAPPTLLYQRETRSHYDVTTPATAFCAVNLLTHSRSPQEVLQSLQKLAGESLGAALESLRERAAAQARRSGVPTALADWPVQVLSFAELLEQARAKDGAAAERILHSASPQAEDILRCCDIANGLVYLAGLEGPAAVVGFAPPFYPLARLEARDAGFLAVIEREAAQMALESGQSIRLRPFFPGISDMSFLNPSGGEEPAQFVALHNPVASLVSAAQTLRCPVVNIGPWGRDYHQKLERLYAPYVFQTLPELLWRIARGVLED